MKTTEKIPVLNMTEEEFITAYRALPTEDRKEIRRLLAEDCRRKGNHDAAERLLKMED